MTASNLSKSLIDYLKQVPDERNASGQRHPMWLILLIIIMGMLSGYGGYRSLGRFVESGNDYLVTVKGNQKTLHRQIKAHTHNTKPIRSYQQSQTTRDRWIERTIEVFEPPLDLDSCWVGVNCVIKVFRHGTRGGQPYQSKSETYYMSSINANSSLIPERIRTHWTIENRLHWVKDVVQGEDSSPKLLGQASTNISILKSWVLNLCRIYGYDSLTEGISYLSHDLNSLIALCH
jgi:predicted transposase YbfD/YdcC